MVLKQNYKDIGKSFWGKILISTFVLKIGFSKFSKFVFRPKVWSVIWKRTGSNVQVRWVVSTLTQKLKNIYKTT